jgi:hypothetical protein
VLVSSRWTGCLSRSGCGSAALPTIIFGALAAGSRLTLTVIEGDAGVSELQQCDVWIGLRREYVERCVCSPQFKLVCRTGQAGEIGRQYWACSCHLAVALEQLAGSGVVVEVLPA